MMTELLSPFREVLSDPGPVSFPWHVAPRGIAPLVNSLVPSFSASVPRKRNCLVPHNQWYFEFLPTRSVRRTPHLQTRSLLSVLRCLETWPDVGLTRGRRDEMRNFVIDVLCTIVL